MSGATVTLRLERDTESKTSGLAVVKPPSGYILARAVGLWFDD